MDPSSKALIRRKGDRRLEKREVRPSCLILASNEDRSLDRKNSGKRITQKVLIA